MVITYKHLEYVFRHILNAEIGKELTDNEKKTKQKENNVLVYHTLNIPETITITISQTLKDLNPNAELFPEDSDEDDPDYVPEPIDVDQEQLDMVMEIDNEDDKEDIIFSQILIDFVEKTLQPFDFNVGTHGRGVLYAMYHPKKYYSFIPMFIRLQQYIHGIASNDPTAMHNFIAVPDLF